MVDIRVVFLGILTLFVSTSIMSVTPIEPSERPSKAFPEVCWYVIDTAKDKVIEKKCKDMNPFLPLSQNQQNVYTFQRGLVTNINSGLTSTYDVCNEELLL